MINFVFSFFALAIKIAHFINFQLQKNLKNTQIFCFKVQTILCSQD